VPGLSSTWTATGGAWQYNSGTSVVGAVDYDVADFPLAPAPGKTLALPDMTTAGADAAAVDLAGPVTAPDLAGAGGGSGGRDGGAPPPMRAQSHGCAMAGAPDTAILWPFVALILAGLFVGGAKRRRRFSQSASRLGLLVNNLRLSSRNRLKRQAERRSG
jgi:MYXO-CTERM domain-containing protein